MSDNTLDDTRREARDAVHDEAPAADGPRWATTAADGPAADGALSGVELTAVMTAAARALATERGRATAPDPYAHLFVDAARAAGFMPALEPGSAQEELWDGIATYLDIRSRYFDEFLAAARTPQVVQLAVGLDTRAFRLDWPAGTVLYELDQPALLEFKQSALDAAGAEPHGCERRVVAGNLGEDWYERLLAAGFDPAAATTWVAEGVLFYLPPPVELRLVEQLSGFRVPGSRLVAEHIAEVGRWMADQRFAAGEQTAGVDLAAMLEPGTRPSPVQQLGESGWDASEQTVGDVARGYGHDGESGPVGLLARYSRYVTAEYRP